MTAKRLSTYIILSESEVDVGAGNLAYLADQVLYFGATRPLLIFDSFLTFHAIIDQLKSEFSLHVVEASQGGPKIAALEYILAIARSVSCDALIGIGGGSILDSAKIVGACHGADKPAPSIQ